VLLEGTSSSRRVGHVRRVDVLCQGLKMSLPPTIPFDIERIIDDFVFMVREHVLSPAVSCLGLSSPRPVCPLFPHHVFPFFLPSRDMDSVFFRWERLLTPFAFIGDPGGRHRPAHRPVQTHASILRWILDQQWWYEFLPFVSSHSPCPSHSCKLCQVRSSFSIVIVKVVHALHAAVLPMAGCAEVNRFYVDILLSKIGMIEDEIFVRRRRKEEEDKRMQERRSSRKPPVAAAPSIEAMRSAGATLVTLGPSGGLPAGAGSGMRSAGTLQPPAVTNVEQLVSLTNKAAAASLRHLMFGDEDSDDAEVDNGGSDGEAGTTLGDGEAAASGAGDTASSTVDAVPAGKPPGGQKQKKRGREETDPGTVAQPAEKLVRGPESATEEVCGSHLGAATVELKQETEEEAAARRAQEEEALEQLKLMVKMESYDRGTSVVVSDDVQLGGAAGCVSADVLFRALFFPLVNMLGVHLSGYCFCVY
jgi:hypothetical protein